MISGKHARSPHGTAVVRYAVNRIKPKTTFSITQPAFQKEHLAQKARIYEFFRTHAYTRAFKGPFARNYAGEPVPEK